jgi:hypothetical protein
MIFFVALFILFLGSIRVAEINGSRAIIAPRRWTSSQNWDLLPFLLHQLCEFHGLQHSLLKWQVTRRLPMKMLIWFPSSVAGARRKGYAIQITDGTSAIITLVGLKESEGRSTSPHTIQTTGKRDTGIGPMYSADADPDADAKPEAAAVVADEKELISECLR